jgi:S1-C subfamily serine protease
LGEEGQGSGVIVDHEGYIVTNYHVVKGAPSILVQLKDGRRAVAESIGDDPETDLSILKIDLPDLMPAEWGDSDKLEVGDLVWALGSPFGLESSLTFGIVSAKARHGGDSLFQEYLQTDAAVNPGNSGGPLVNIEGQIIGINSAIVGPSYQGISFAIPSTLAHARYDEIRRSGRVERSWLGVAPTVVPTGMRKQLKLGEKEGVLIEEVEPKSPADRAGFRRGDVILQWNGATFNDPNMLTQAIASTAVGSTAKAVVLRQNEEGESEKVELQLTMERRPKFVPRIRRGR